MTTAFGADPLKDGTGKVTTGTTPEDIRQIFGSLYSEGLISGGIITRSATQLQYVVSNGVAAFPIVTDNSTPPKPENRRTVLGPIPATTLTTTAPATGTRTDIIYAQQLTPGDDGNANVVVKVGVAPLPPRSVLLGSYIVSAGVTNTNTAVKTGDVKYSIPYGASMGLWYQHRSAYNSTFSGRGADGAGSFFLPTDRLVRISLSTTMSAYLAVGFDNSKYCEAGFDIFIDGVKKFSWSTPGLHQARAEYNFTDVLTLPQGAHTIRYERYRLSGTGFPYQHSTAGNIGNLISVEDIGPVA